MPLYRSVYCEFWVRTFYLGYDRSNDPFWTPLFDLRLAAHPIIPNRSGLFSGWDFCLWDRGIIRTSGYVLMAASPIWHPLPLSGIGAIRQTCSDRKFELGAVKWESENEEQVLFCPCSYYRPWGEEICTRWGKVNVKYLFLPANQRALMRLRRLFQCAFSARNSTKKCFRRSEFLEWKVNVIRNVPRDSSSTKNKFKICTFRQKVNKPKNFNWIIEGNFWDGFQRQWVHSLCHLHY